jgi:hypothetical protein
MFDGVSHDIALGLGRCRSIRCIVINALGFRLVVL